MIGAHCIWKFSTLSRNFRYLFCRRIRRDPEVFLPGRRILSLSRRGNTFRARIYLPRYSGISRENERISRERATKVKAAMHFRKVRKYFHR